MTNSRAKGARGEREWRDFLKAHGYEARRGQQFSGANGDPDVVSSMHDIHWEVKRVEALNIYKAIEQAQSDARENELPCVAHRKNGQPWLVTMLASDWMEVYQNHDKGCDDDGAQE